ncbi:MAG: FMN reductase [Thalassobius sp.]|nr:FMN reductase [Thalassovita sp.]
MPNNKKRILAISGSTNLESSSTSLLKYIAKTFKDQLEVEIFDGIDKLPHFNPIQSQVNTPQEVLAFREKIDLADGVIFCTPEYVFSLPGSLKNAIEWNVSTTVFSNKPVAIIVAAASGEKAFESLKLILTTIEAQVNEEATLLIKGAKGKIGKSGEVIDQATIEQIDDIIAAFCQCIEDKNPIPTKYQ